MEPISETDERIKNLASRLRMPFIRDHLTELFRAATDAHFTPRETIEYFFKNEIEQREANRIKLAVMSAHFGFECSLESFDIAAQQSIDPGTFRELSKLEWIKTAENVVFLGPPGVGKTHLAIGLGRRAIQYGYSVRFISASSLLLSLEKAKKEGSLIQKISDFNKYKLLIIDELGYLPLEPSSAHLLYQLISKRYLVKSTIVTSNRPPSEWGLIFGDSECATAILDRLLHKCTVLTMLGDSYRIKEAKKAKLVKENIK